MKTEHDASIAPDLALDPELHAYVDGKLSPERMAEIEARLAGNAAERAAVTGWARDRDLIREAAAAADNRPPDLRTELLARELARRVRARRIRSMMNLPTPRQLAASIAIFVAGWGGHAVYVSGERPPLADQPGFVTQAALLHSVYDQGEIAELNISDQRMHATLDWLSETMQRKIESPELEAMGLRVIGARLVRGETGPIAQFTYERVDESGLITVSMTPHPDSQPLYPYEVRSVSDHAVAYWTNDGVDFAVIGEDEPARLATLASVLR